MGTAALRRVIVLVLLAAGCLLIVPGVAGAGVSKKYRAEYKSQLSKLDTYFQACVDAYGHNKAACLEWTEAVRDALDDPEQLVVARQGALKVYDTQKDTPQHACDGFDELVAEFKAGASRYFTSAAQRNQFKVRLARVGEQGGIAIRADAYIYNAWKALGADPPDFEFSSVSVAYGDNDLAAGQKGYATWRTKLKALL
jgi:hypothetical protein